MKTLQQILPQALNQANWTSGSTKTMQNHFDTEIPETAVTAQSAAESKGKPH